MNLIERIKSNPASSITNGVYYLNSPTTNNPAEEIYLKTRKAEGRLYGDDIVKKLPDFPHNHKYSHEWNVRKISSQGLINYLSDREGKKNILDLGCGNGWLSHKLSNLDNSSVIAIDINRTELEQAARIFLPKNNLLYAYTDIFEWKDMEFKFDFIILSAVIQYFKDMISLIRNLLDRINDNGEIHIIDSPFYTKTNVLDARERSASYYREICVPEMAQFYHHHKIEELPEKFNTDILYNPKGLVNRITKGLSKNYSPFYWIRITKLQKSNR